MKRVIQSIVCLILGIYTLHAQGTQSPATASQLKYFRFLLSSLGSPDYSAEYIKQHEDLLVPLLGLLQRLPAG